MERVVVMNDVIENAVPGDSKIENFYRLNLGQFVSKPCSSDVQENAWQRKIIFIGVTAKPSPYIEAEALCRAFEELERADLLPFTLDDYAAFDLKLITGAEGHLGSYRCPA